MGGRRGRAAVVDGHRHDRPTGGHGHERRRSSRRPRRQRRTPRRSRRLGARPPCPGSPSPQTATRSCRRGRRWPPATAVPFAFRVTGPDGHPVTALHRGAREGAAPDRRAARPLRLPARAPGAVPTAAPGRSTSTWPGAAPTGCSPTSVPAGLGQQRWRWAPISRRRRLRAVAAAGARDDDHGRRVRRHARRRPGSPGDESELDLHGQPRRPAGRRPAALPRRLRTPGRHCATATWPTCTPTPPRRRRPASAGVRTIGFVTHVPVGGDLPALPRLPGRRVRCAPPSSPSRSAGTDGPRGPRTERLHRRARHRRHDVRLLRGPDREEAQPDGRRRRPR